MSDESLRGHDDQRERVASLITHHSSLFGSSLSTFNSFCYPPPSHHDGGKKLAKLKAEYIWIDGQKPTAKLRSKTKIIDEVKSIKDVPDWGYDGSSTEQASGHFSDLQLRPVRHTPDPLHGERDVLVLCEVL